jgi:hypothetical protein
MHIPLLEKFIQLPAGTDSSLEVVIEYVVPFISGTPEMFFKLRGLDVCCHLCRGVVMWIFIVVT